MNKDLLMEFDAFTLADVVMLNARITFYKWYMSIHDDMEFYSVA